MITFHYARTCDGARTFHCARTFHGARTFDGAQQALAADLPDRACQCARTKLELAQRQSKAHEALASACATDEPNVAVFLASLAQALAADLPDRACQGARTKLELAQRQAKAREALASACATDEPNVVLLQASLAQALAADLPDSACQGARTTLVLAKRQPQARETLTSTCATDEADVAHLEASLAQALVADLTESVCEEA